MGRGNTDLDSREYDYWLASNKRERELRERKQERKFLSRNVEGWHFGIDPNKPIHTKNKEEFKKELDKRGLMMADDVKDRSIIDRKQLVRELSEYEKKRR